MQSKRVKSLAIILKRCLLCAALPSVLVGIAAVTSGCSGINASKSISPLDFILPGLMRNDPPAPVIPLQTNAVALLAPGSHRPL